MAIKYNSCRVVYLFKDVQVLHAIQLLDVVALAENLPEHKLHRGQVGTVVELLASNVFEVEFSDDEGQTYAMLALRADQLIVLHYQIVEAA